MLIQLTVYVVCIAAVLVLFACLLATPHSDLGLHLCKSLILHPVYVCLIGFHLLLPSLPCRCQRCGRLLFSFW